MRAILSVTGLSKRFGGVVAADNVDFEVRDGEVHAVIGPNGAGKSTLVRLLSGMHLPDAGAIRFDGADITRASLPERSQLGLVQSFQITSIFRNLTVLQNVALSVQAGAGHSFRFWRAADRDRALTEPAREFLDQVGLGGRAGAVAANLSHGEQRHLEIAMVLATRPKLVLLDEPTAGMGPEETARITAFLLSLKGRYSTLLIEHDMDAVFSVADRITVLVRGQSVACGTPAEIRDNTTVQAAYLGSDGG